MVHRDIAASRLDVGHFLEDLLPLRPQIEEVDSPQLPESAELAYGLLKLTDPFHWLHETLEKDTGSEWSFIVRLLQCIHRLLW
jgi:hypothetical protein